MLSKERLKELVEMQDTLNKATAGDDWAAKGYRWRLYAIMEAAEAIESLPYKHWKKGEANFENVKVEIVDIFHFMFSDSLVGYAIDDIVTIVNDGQVGGNDSSPEPFHVLSLLNTIADLIPHLGNEDSRFPDDIDTTIYMQLFTAWKILGETPESLYKAYMVKNALNGFRQKNGYKAGTYKKMWQYNGEVVEDNVVAYDVSESIDIGDNFATTLGKKLGHAYKEA